MADPEDVGLEPGAADGGTPAPTALPSLEGLELADVVGALYAAGGMTRPVVLEADSPEATVDLMTVLGGLGQFNRTQLAAALVASLFGISLVALLLARGYASSILADSFGAPIAYPTLAGSVFALQTVIMPGRLQRGLRWMVPALIVATVAVVGASTGAWGTAVSVALMVGLVAALLHALILLTAPAVDRGRLCRRHPGLWRALGWRAVLLGARPAVDELSTVLGRGLAVVCGHPLRGRLARDGQPRVRRHGECVQRLEAALRRVDLPEMVTWGLGCGLPGEHSLWNQARGEAATLGRRLDLPQDGRGTAAWERGGPDPHDDQVSLRALAAARALEAEADVAWLLRGVAVVLPAPRAGVANVAGESPA